MIRTIARIGNSLFLIFDTALRESTGLQEGDAIDVTVREDGCVVITSYARRSRRQTRPRPHERNASLFERLSN